jgi:hypothetical protein
MYRGWVSPGTGAAAGAAQLSKKQQLYFLCGELHREKHAWKIGRSTVDQPRISNKTNYSRKAGAVILPRKLGPVLMHQLAHIFGLVVLSSSLGQQAAVETPAWDIKIIVPSQVYSIHRSVKFQVVNKTKAKDVDISVGLESYDRIDDVPNGGWSYHEKMNDIFRKSEDAKFHYFHLKGGGTLTFSWSPTSQLLYYRPKVGLRYRFSVDVLQGGCGGYDYVSNSFCFSRGKKFQSQDGSLMKRSHHAS